MGRPRRSDRDELNEVYFLGLGRPTAATIHSTARFYKPQWQWLWAEHDPNRPAACSTRWA